MSMKDKRVKSVVESDEENEQGACGISNDSRRFSLAVPEPTPGNQLDDSVDNLSMEVHLGGDSSCHPSEISSVSYQNLLDDGEPSNSVISRRGSDDSLDSYPPDFPDAELLPDDLETFEASDLPLSEHFPMGAIQGADMREKSRGDRSSYVSDNSSNISHQNIRLKDQSCSDSSDNVKMREKTTNEPNLDIDEASSKRSSLEIRNNIPVVGEAKDYEKELNIDFSRAQGHKSIVIGLKQSPGVARRVDDETHIERDSSSAEDAGKQCESALPSSSGQQYTTRLKPKKTYSKSKENVIEVITPIPRNINIENEYDYVKYARVQQGNSYVGMRLAYSSSSDSLNIKQGVFSEDNSREPSPEKNLQQKILSDHGSQEKVCEETLMEIPLNNNDYPEDKKAFTLSPENTECDSVEVESVTSEGENSTPGFPTLEDGLSSSQASDAEEGASGVDRSPSKLLQSKQKAAVEQDLLSKEEDCRPKEMDAQAIMNDLKMKREALDMAIADIKSAIQRSKSMSLEPSYPNQTEAEVTQPVWVKRVNKDAANQTHRRQEEMRRVQEEIERQQEELGPSQARSHQELCDREKFEELFDVQDDITLTGQQLASEGTEEQVKSEAQSYTGVTFEDNDNSIIFQTKLTNSLSEETSRQVSLDKDTSINPQTRIIIDNIGELQLNEMEQRKAMNPDCVSESSKHFNNNPHILNNTMHYNFSADSSAKQEPASIIPSSSSPDNVMHVKYDTEINQCTFQNIIHNFEQCEDFELATLQASEKSDSICFEDGNKENIVSKTDTSNKFFIDEEKCLSIDSTTIHTVSNIFDFGSLDLAATEFANRLKQTEIVSVRSCVPSLTFQATAKIQQFDRFVQEGQSIDTDIYGKEEGKQHCVEDTINISDFDIQSMKAVNTVKVEDSFSKSAIVEHLDNDDSEGSEDTDDVTAKEEICVTKEVDDLIDNVRQDGLPRGYDSDDECEDAEGIRYTRRIKGKKYAPLQKDDSLEMSGACAADGDSDVVKSNGYMFTNKHGSYLGSNGSLVSHIQQQPLPHSGDHHIRSSETRLSSEENSDTNANITSYTRPPKADSDTDEETDRLLQKQYQERDKHVEIPELSDPAATGIRSEAEKRQSKAKEAAIRDPDRPEVLIEGVLFRARYLGSTQLISEGQPSKAMRMMQAQEAVGRIKTLGVLHFGERFQAPEGENQPSTDVDLFVSTEKIMVLNTDLQEIMMDHSLRTISYIADIGDILVIMARRRLITSPDDLLGRRRRQAKILCHVFESDEAQLIAQSIGQAFQVAYLEFLKANGIEDPGLLKEMDYQDVLNQQEIYGEELNLFANKDFHKEVIVPKTKNEPLGVVIVESGWGSMVPTVVLANMLPTGPAARCGQLNIGDQIISINGMSLVGLPLSACQTYIKASRSQTVVKLTVVPCPPVVEVLIKRPDVKYQLGFSVQNGVICSLLRGGIAERGGVRVGHRIIEINNQSVVAVPHEKIVTLLASSVGEIHMKTMPTSIFRLLTGQDVPHYL